MVFDWISNDTQLSKYLAIFRLSPKMNVILVDFSQEIVWPEATKKWPHRLQWRAEFCGMLHSSGFSVPPSGCDGNILKHFVQFRYTEKVWLSTGKTHCLLLIHYIVSYEILSTISFLA